MTQIKKKFVFQKGHFFNEASDPWTLYLTKVGTVKWKQNLKCFSSYEHTKFQLIAKDIKSNVIYSEIY